MLTDRFLRSSTEDESIYESITRDLRGMDLNDRRSYCANSTRFPQNSRPLADHILSDEEYRRQGAMFRGA